MSISPRKIVVAAVAAAGILLSGAATGLSTDHAGGTGPAVETAGEGIWPKATARAAESA